MKKNILTIVVFSILVISVLITSSYSSASTFPRCNPEFASLNLEAEYGFYEGSRRQDMMSIAELYCSYQWVGTEENTRDREAGNIYTPDLASCNDDDGQLTKFGCWCTDVQFDTGQCIIEGVPYEINYGIPYYWGASTPVDDVPGDDIPDFNLQSVEVFMSSDARTFGERLVAPIPAPAGDISTTGSVSDWYANGVECTGLVAMTWEVVIDVAPSKAKELGYPIRFQDLRPGDILLRYVGNGPYDHNHAIVFEEWGKEEGQEEVYDPGSGIPPEPGVKFWVYESATEPKKVVRSEYQLISYDEDGVTIKRLQFCDPIQCVPDPRGYQASNYIPRTYIHPSDIVLVIDRSGSMSGEKLQMAKNAAQLFVDMMRPGDKISVVSFGSSATVELELKEIRLPDDLQYEDVKAQAHAKITQITAGGGTAIGQGLMAAREQLNGINQNDPNRIIILLSDGEETDYNPTALDALETIKDDEIIVHTLALGSGADWDLMQKLAFESGGIYRYILENGMPDIYTAIYSELYNENVVKRAQGIVAQDSTNEEQIQIDSTIGNVRFGLIWPGSDLDLTLVQPDGTIIDPTTAENDPDITFTANSTYEFYEVYAPQSGLWTMRIFGKSTDTGSEDYIATISALDGMIVSVDVEGTNHTIGQPIKLYATVEDSSPTNPLGSEYIRGATMTATVVDPAESQYVFDLYDDGLHGDELADDGVYANYFTDTHLEGSYNFNVVISGTNNLYGEDFTREYSLSTTVTAPEFPLTSILDDFNRADGAIGDNWSGNPSGYVIDTNQLKVKQKNDNLDIYWEDTYFGPDQEVYFTFSTVSSTAHDQTLLLKSQDNSGWGYGVLAVQYAAATNSVVVWSFIDPSGTTIDPIPLEPLDATMSVIIGPDSQPPSDQKWTPHGFLTSVTFTSGDQFGARALADGTVEIYKNGVLLATCDISSWPFYDQGGYIGLWFGDAKDVLIDDFGGGDIP
ncbi:VWA domain-containing protein [bacterium]|nr:VWA domain-containing protein [bacterium]